MLTHCRVLRCTDNLKLLRSLGVFAGSTTPRVTAAVAMLGPASTAHVLQWAGVKLAPDGAEYGFPPSWRIGVKQALELAAVVSANAQPGAVFRAAQIVAAASNLGIAWNSDLSFDEV